ncbi:MAG: endonuclease III domain-containing protein [bacterium]
MKLPEIYHILLEHFDRQHWWPADTPFEVIVGAILTQNTNWNNVVKAIDNLKREKFLTPVALDKADQERLEKAVRPSGFWRQKASRLKYFTRYLKTHYDYDLDKFLVQPKMKLRRELLAMHGIGRETADSIILYAANKPVFVIDAYTKRMCHRIGVTRLRDYDELRRLFEDRLPRQTQLYNEFHALIVELAKNYCKKKPQCGNCPLKGGCRYMRGLGSRQNKIFQVKKSTGKKYIPKTKKKKK